MNKRHDNGRRNYLGRGIAACCLAAALAVPAAAQDTLLHTFTRAALPSVVSRSLAGAGTALPFADFGGLVNPALTMAVPENSSGTIAAGYGRDPLFDKLALPLGVIFNDGSGTLGGYYRFLNGEKGTVHDATLNIAGRMFEQIDTQGPVEFGVNVRYEHSKWRYYLGGADTAGVPAGVDAKIQNILFDIGFYQPHVLPWLDFALTAANLNGYRWAQVGDGAKTKGWMGWGYCSVIVGALVNIPLLGDNLLFRIPLDIDIANLFSKGVGNGYSFRAGLDAQIIKMFNVRFGYARAPEDPLDLLTDFDHKNLFYGGFGVFVNPIQFDFFAGKDEFGASVTYWY